MVLLPIILYQIDTLSTIQSKNCGYNRLLILVPTSCFGLDSTWGVFNLNVFFDLEVYYIYVINYGWFNYQPYQDFW